MQLGSYIRMNNEVYSGIREVQLQISSLDWALMEMRFCFLGVAKQLPTASVKTVG